MADVVKSTIQKRDAKGVIRHGAEWLALWSDPDSLKTGEERRSESDARQLRLTEERQLAAVARSLSGDPELQFAFRPPSPAGDAPSLQALRGEVDSYALTRRFHSIELHREFAPADFTAHRLFDLCEHVRCEALGSALFPGVLDNLVAQQRERLTLSGLHEAHLASLVPLAEALRMVLRDALLDKPDPSIPSAASRMWDSWIRSRFSGVLKSLRDEQQTQASYAPMSLALIDNLLDELGSDAGQLRRFIPTAGPGADEDRSVQGDLREAPGGGIFESGGELFLDDAPKPLEYRADEAAPPPPYRAFTTAHDLVARPADLVDLATLREARNGLDRRRAGFRRDLARLVMRLQRRIMARQARDWAFDLEEGLIDAARLDRVIVNPGFSHAYKMERQSEFRDSAVFILIDNSGSMRGKPIEIACLAADLISAALERCGIVSEILGFTTRGWKGGESFRDWTRAGRPTDPGRLNDVLHIIYKSAEEPVRRSRQNLCAMLESSILKENIDGESLLWAARRLLARPERRKVLIVISDGAPVDQATLESNADKDILDRHLREAIREIENPASGIELAAIGVKHDVARYYRRSIQIDKIDSLGVSLVATIDDLLSP